MKTLLAGLLLVPAVAFAGSAFDGTWKANLESMKVTGKPDVVVLANGEFRCVSCVPQLTVKADGQEHAVTGHPYYDAVTVTVVSPTTVTAVYKLKGKETLRETDTVAADGKSYTGTFTDHSGSKEVSGSFTETRVAAGPAGAHAISGSWQQAPGMQGNEALVIVNYELVGDHFKMHYNGRSYDAPLDGSPVPVQGDPGHTTVSLKRVDANTLMETDHREGKVIDEVRLAAASDGKTIKVEDQDLAHGQTMTYVLDKQ